MRWFISILVVLALVAGLWWMEQQRQAKLSPETEVQVPSDAEQPEPRYPLPKPEVHPAPPPEEATQAEAQANDEPDIEPEPQPPLPDLADSDAAALEALSGLLGDEVAQQWIKPEFIISRTVAVINSLDGQAPALKTRPLRALDAEPLAEDIEDGETLLWTEADAQRYDALINTLESVSPERAASLYARHYPLFQQAWDELGEAESHFNDRLIDVIDHLLSTPDLEGPFEVIPYEGRMHFADESLQQASWGRKLLIRMGAERAGRIKEWLRRFRNAAIGNAEPLPDQTLPNP